MLSSQRSNWGHLASEGSKSHFRQKCDIFFMSHSMAMKLIQVHKLEILQLFCGVKSQLGVIWGYRVKRLFLPKML